MAFFHHQGFSATSESSIEWSTYANFSKNLHSPLIDGFFEGSLSVITIHTLELLDWKGFAAFVLLMSCNVGNHGPGLTHLHDLEHFLAGR